MKFFTIILNNPVIKLVKYGGRKGLFWLITALFVSIINIALTIFTSLYLGNLSDSAIEMELGGFVDTLIPMLVLMLLQIPAAFTRTFAATKFSELCLYNLRNASVNHIQKLPLTLTDKQTNADLLSRVNNDLTFMQQFFQNFLVEIIVQPLTFLICAAFLFNLSFNLSLVSFTIIPIFMLITIIISKPIEKLTQDLQEIMSESTSVAQNGVSGIAVVKSFQLEHLMEKKFSAVIDRAINIGLRVSKVSAVVSPLRGMMQFVPFVLVFAYGGFLVLSDNLTFGQLITFINLSNAVVNPLEIFPQAIAQFRLAQGAGSRILEIFTYEVEESGVLISDASEAGYAIEFKDVEFAYEGKEKILKGIELNLGKGETVALVGSSGSGKSTIIKLIGRFLKSQYGQIKIFGIDINEWNIEKLRENIAIVSQDTYLFPCSIFENISYGKIDSTLEEVYNAAILAGIHDFILTLPDGYNSQVGERGVKLSGGQKQRISIARALLKDAPILLLDEATSSLDSESEHNIQKNLEILMRNRSTIIIAHRFSSLKAASKVYVLNDGIVEAHGNHKEMSECSETYNKLFQSQFGKNVEVGDALDSCTKVNIEAVTI